MLMTSPPDEASPASLQAKEELLHLLSISGTLSGICIGGVTLFHTMNASSRAGTLVDDLLAICALGFLICTYLIVWALRTRVRRYLPQLVRLVDGMFLLSLTGLVLAGFLMVYTVL
ncbi:MAG: hypothetical protein JWQ90_5093 [Hydrocarboniphaga sp.]|uniref:hypothetical protein n=1 Tax=Hydrocarboniphaga sp. TaxID=2033016 RepID=UPI00261B89D1|nr:hypothetical protein [Hydrocarboniphaga sp.]MDB5972643.1 hypothetical protein [Hydrocarboniphaga sp.]